LKYSTFSKNWYKTGVFINGKKHTGYIHKSDVGTPDNPEKLRGIGLKQPTDRKSTRLNSSHVSISYAVFCLKKKKNDLFIKCLLILFLLYFMFYFYIIHRLFLTLSLFPYTTLFRSLKYSTFSKNWYKTGVFINGKKHTGYIHKSDVGTPDNPEKLRGIGLKQP